MPPFTARTRVKLCEWTTLRVGGEARLFLEPRTPEEACEAIAHLHKEKIPFRVLGGGSNILAPDEGYDGAVLATERMKSTWRQGELMRLDAGVSMPGLVHDSIRNRQSGLEGLVGIPGSVGGAVRMNSGGRHGVFWDLIEEIEVCDPQGNRRTLKRADAKPVYRNGGLGDLVCLAATIRLRPGNPKEIEAKTAAILAEKAAAQPLTERSAGCMFKNPEGGSAGKLIEQAGCKGWKEGDAVVSEKHGNFFLNRGKARAADIKKLVARVQDEVKRRCGVELHTEIVTW